MSYEEKNPKLNAGFIPTCPEINTNCHPVTVGVLGSV